MAAESKVHRRLSRRCHKTLCWWFFLRTNRFASFVASQAGVADSFANARRMVRKSGKK